MMKSLFTKYITAIAVILLVSFLMLSSIISVSIDDFATEARRDDILLISAIATAIMITTSIMTTNTMTITMSIMTATASCFFC